MTDRDTAGSGGAAPAAASPVDTAEGTAGHVRRKIGETGRDTVHAAQGRIRAAFEQQSHRAADQLDTVAHALQSAAEQLKDENAGTAARYAGEAAHRVEEVADIIRNATVDDAIGRVERFARRNPEVFLGAAFGAGFLFARFVKSSGERRFRSAARPDSGLAHPVPPYAAGRVSPGGAMPTSDIAGAYPPAGPVAAPPARPAGSATGGAPGPGPGAFAGHSAEPPRPSKPVGMPGPAAPGGTVPTAPGVVP